MQINKKVMSDNMIKNQKEIQIVDVNFFQFSEPFRKSQAYRKNRS